MPCMWMPTVFAEKECLKNKRASCKMGVKVYNFSKRKTLQNLSIKEVAPKALRIGNPKNKCHFKTKNKIQVGGFYPIL